MKVIIPVIEDEKSKHLLVDEFKNASKVCIYDQNTSENNILPISQLIRNAGNISLELKSNGIDTVISSNMSFLSLSLLLDSEFKVFQAKGGDPADNFQLFLKDQLEPYNRFNALRSFGCSPLACSSCTSEC